MLATPVVRVEAQQPERTGLGIRLIDAPVARKDDPRALVFIIDHVAAGTRFSRRFEVKNDTGRPIVANLYVASASIASGGFNIEPGRGSGELSAWGTVEPTRVDLAQGETATASVTLEVPAGARSGEFYGAVIAELPAPEARPGTVAIASRVGIRVYLSVGGNAEPETDFELPTFRPIRQPDGKPAIEIDGCNTGGRAVDLAGEVELTNGPGGTKAGPFPTLKSTTLAPGQCTTFTVPLDKELPDGPWDATAKLRSGNEERTAQARITFPRNAGERGNKVETREVTGSLPGIIALGFSILLLLIILGLLLWFVVKRRRR